MQQVEDVVVWECCGACAADWLCRGTDTLHRILAPLVQRVTKAYR